MRNEKTVFGLQTLTRISAVTEKPTSSQAVMLYKDKFLRTKYKNNNRSGLPAAIAYRGHHQPRQMKMYFRINNVAKTYIVGVIFLKLPHAILMMT